jgi:hypothetical protein
MTSHLFQDEADRRLAEAIHGMKVAATAEQLLAAPGDLSVAARGKAEDIIAACRAVERQIDEASADLITRLQDAGVEAQRIGLGHGAQFPLFRLSVPPQQLDTVLEVARAAGYVGAEGLSDGARAALKRAGRMIMLMRTDGACMRVALHWRSRPPAPLPLSFAPDALDAATLSLPAALWPVYIAWRPIRVAMQRFGLVDLALQSDAIRPEAHLFTPDSLIEPLLDALDLRAGQRFLDVGCGDGRIVCAAARRGLDACGVEMNGALAARAQTTAAAFKGQGRVSIRHGAVAPGDIAAADGVFLFQPSPVFPGLLKSTLAHLKPGARIISHEQSPMGSGLTKAMQPTRAIPLASEDALTVAYIWRK